MFSQIGTSEGIRNIETVRKMNFEKEKVAEE